MLPSLSSIKNKTQKPAICCYINTSTHVEIARITNIPNWSFERVVFPGQRLIFEAPLTARLEIHTGTAISSILSETINCQELQLTSYFPEYSVK